MRPLLPLLPLLSAPTAHDFAALLAGATAHQVYEEGGGVTLAWTAFVHSSLNGSASGGSASNSSSESGILRVFCLERQEWNVSIGLTLYEPGEVEVPVNVSFQASLSTGFKPC